MVQKNEFLYQLNATTEQAFNIVGEKMKSFEASSKKLAAISYTLVSSLFFVLVSIFVKMLHGFNSSQILYFRCIISLVLNSILIKYNKKPAYTENKSIHKLLMIRCLISGVSHFCFYKAMHMLNVSNAITIFQTAPFWTTILAWIILKEKISNKIVITIFCSFCGIILVIQPQFLKEMLGIISPVADDSGSSSLGFIYGISFSLCISLATVIIKKLSHHLHYTTILQYGLCSGLIISITDIIHHGEFDVNIFLPTNFLYAFLVAFFNYAAQILYSRAITLEKASKLAPLHYTQVLYGFILEVSIFHKEISTMSLFGAGMIVFGNLITIRGK